MFRYASQPKGGPETVAFIGLEALLVKVSGEWKVVMEFQKSELTEVDWFLLK
jgi:hypothetical protein